MTSLILPFFTFRRTSWPYPCHSDTVSDNQSTYILTGSKYPFLVSELERDRPNHFRVTFFVHPALCHNTNRNLCVRWRCYLTYLRYPFYYLTFLTGSFVVFFFLFILLSRQFSPLTIFLINSLTVSSL